MCWNAEVSLQSFFIGTIALLIAYAKGLSLPITLFGLSVTAMQLVEYVVWTYYDNQTVNHYASLAAAVVLGLQPVASMMMLPTSLRLPSMSLYGVLTGILILLDSADMKKKYRMVRAPNGHLEWKFLKLTPLTYVALLHYMVFLFYPILLTKSWTFLGISLTTLGISLYTYLQSNTWGSMWCWIVNYMFTGVALKQILETSF